MWSDECSAEWGKGKKRSWDDFKEPEVIWPKKSKVVVLIRLKGAEVWMLELGSILKGLVEDV